MMSILIHDDNSGDNSESNPESNSEDPETSSSQHYKRGDSNEICSGIALTSKSITFKRGGIFNPSVEKLNSNTADITLIAEKRKLYAHKHVLASNSVYFERMFAGYFKEQNKNTVEINMANLSYGTMKTLIQFFYTMTLCITEFNVQDLLIGSNLFLCEDVQQACVNYLKIMIDCENCLSLKDFASSLSLDELYSLCINYIINNFRFVCKNEAFMLSTFKEIMMFIQDDNLFAKEDMVYDVVMDWVKYDLKARYRYCTNLLWYIRLPLVLNTYQGIISVKDYQCAKLDSVSSFRLEHRKPFRKGILLINHNPLISTPEWFDATINQWQTCTSEDCHCTNFKTVINPPIHWATCVLHDNGSVLLAVGGIVRGVATKTVRKFDSKTGRWGFMPSMNFQRVKPYVIQIKSKIFVIGGCKKLSHENTIEYLDLDQHEWFPINNKIGKFPNMSREYIYAACVNQSIYIIGMKKAGFFNPLTNNWNTISPIPNIRFGSAVCVLNNNIYVIGGQRKGIFYKNVFAFCTETKVWVSVAEMNIPRSHPGVAVMNGNIYVFGGRIDDTNISNTFEIYNFHTNTWTVSSAPMNMGRSDCNAIVVEKCCLFYKKVFEDRINMIH